MGKEKVLATSIFYFFCYYAPKLINGGGGYSFWLVCLSVCLSAKTFTLPILFDLEELGSSYFT